MGKVNIRDVAKEAGVSIATVSNALNNSQVVHPKTREHVLSVIERLNYSPASNAKRPRLNANKAIGLFVISMTGDYYGNLADSMFYALQRFGYDLEIYMVRGLEDVLRRLASGRIDGAVIFCGTMTPKDRAQLLDAGVPIVFLDQEVSEKNASCVLYDSFEAGEMAAEYLLGLGHRDLMHVSGLCHNYDSIQRQRGFFHALERAGVPFRQENLLEGRFERAAAYREMHLYVSKGYKLPDAIFASNDLSAIGIIDVLREIHIRVPEDISIIGCDDNVLAQFVASGLTTIRTQMNLIGETASSEIIRLIAKKTGRVNRIPGRIIVRQSCAARQAPSCE